MKVYVFKAGSVYGFTTDPQGANLPPDQAGPWKDIKSLNMESGEPARIGIDTDAVLMGIHDRGFYLTAAKIEGD